MMLRVAKLTLDTTKSRVRIRTFAEGLLARLAHDLELVCRDVVGHAERTGADDASATVEIPIAGIDVAGVLKGGHLDASGLSPGDRADAVTKMRKDVFHESAGTTAVVRAEGTLEGGKARIRITPPNGRAVTRSVELRITEEGADSRRVSGRFDLSLDALGADPVRGPMNAFRVKDSVEVVFELVFTATL